MLSKSDSNRNFLNNQLISKYPGPGLGYMLVFSAVTSKGVMGFIVMLGSINVSLNTPCTQFVFLTFCLKLPFLLPYLQTSLKKQLEYNLVSEVFLECPGKAYHPLYVSIVYCSQ